MLKEQLDRVRELRPLVHNITNYVTVNDCANIQLACGASPIMADDPEETGEITSICSALNINIGTLNQSTIPSMLAAGRKANELGLPVVLDPVGAGASRLRSRTALRLLEELRFSVIRGNISEIKALALGAGATKGVDADFADAVTEDTLEEAASFVRQFAKKAGAVVVVTGAIDLAADAEKAYAVRNGHPMMSRVTGTGCMLTALIGALLAVNPETPLLAAVAGVCAMGLCGEIAYERLAEGEGNASYRNRIIDQVYHLRGDSLEAGARLEEL